MAVARRACKNKRDLFCYICGEYTLSPNRNEVTDFLKSVYKVYFGMKLGDQDKPWAPHIVCKVCTESLRNWSKGCKTSMKFGIPMVWREPKNHVNDCYFCAVNVTGINRKNRGSLKYPDIESARRPVAHCDDIPIPVFKSIPDISDDENSSIPTEDEEFYMDVDVPNPFTQKELNDLVRDLGLSKSSSELLASRLRGKNLTSGVRISFYRNRHQEFLQFFSMEKDLVYCTDIALLLRNLGLPEYKANDWRLFIDSSKRSLKCVLLHNGNQYGSIPLTHLTTMKESYEAVKLVLEKICHAQICNLLSICGTFAST